MYKASVGGQKFTYKELGTKRKIKIRRQGKGRNSGPTIGRKHLGDLIWQLRSPILF